MVFLFSDTVKAYISNFQSDIFNIVYGFVGCM